LEAIIHLRLNHVNLLRDGDLSRKMMSRMTYYSFQTLKGLIISKFQDHLQTSRMGFLEEGGLVTVVADRDIVVANARHAMSTLRTCPCLDLPRLSEACKACPEQATRYRERHMQSASRSFVYIEFH
jgi:hypothetical protein